MPRPRPAVEKLADETAPVPANPAATPEAELEVPLPRPRPDPKVAASPVVDEKAEPATEATPVEAEPEEVKPPRIYQTACPAVLSGQVEAKSLPPLIDNQCREQSPLAVTAVLANGRMIPFSAEATLNCGMATALPTWATAVDSYLMARENTRIESILVGTSYMCRTRNHVENADVSEHGFANALDMVGFELEDGRTVTLSGGWADALSPEGRLLRFAHDAGCASFTTTLGPEANALHADHLHLDLGCHGKTCAARLCE
ncbi:MAG: extensin-like domain-containing protein [Devosia sp.]